ncbi:transcriptional repressor of the rex ndh operon [Lysinibacillus capsici]|uniref:Transcriptional repressor of the rex ndh operon n=1 Tax=Lysinibacillus capsici TaxID=2115968 RepID=A0A2X0XIF4_9BACI|nr:DUF1641 domain-containing protein [Lysinibacillus capsici]SPT98719.1 transcriptional repressor of the rex ndh operon [Lysinibacillus capsici]
MSETNNQTQAEQVTVSKEQLDVLDQLLKPEVQESLTTLVEQLPKLTEMMTLLTKSYEFAQAVATEIAGPVVGSAKNLAATAIEAKDRASESHEVIGLFGLVKMLKDPQVQNVFRFVNAFLQVSSERKAK